MTFFIQFFPELIREGHLFILQTPLFRVRNKQQTIYCYSDAEREEAIGLLGKNPEITRVKGLGEISPQEFKAFIGEGMRLDRVRLEDSHKVKDLLSFYMGKNTRERQEYILNILRVELDPVMDKSNGATLIYAYHSQGKTADSHRLHHGRQRPLGEQPPSAAAGRPPGGSRYGGTLCGLLHGP